MKEIKSIKKNKTWELTDFPRGVKLNGVKWVFKTKFKENGEIVKFKARLVAKGYAQQYGLYARLECYFQLDVRSASLHGKLKGDIYV